jgi:hypothetical protein
MRLAAETARTNNSRIARAANCDAKPALPSAARKVCGMGPDQVYGPVTDERDYQAGAQDEHQRDDWRGDGDRLSNVAPSVTALAGHDGDIFKTVRPPTVIWPKIARLIHETPGHARGIGV